MIPQKIKSFRKENEPLIKIYIGMFIIGYMFYIVYGTIKVDHKKEEYVKNYVELVKTGKEEIENTARRQARSGAESIGSCIHKLKLKHNLSTLEEFSIAANICGADYRNFGKTGDMFVFDRISRVMIYDGSPDCMKGGEGRDFDYAKEIVWIKNKEQKGECWMHSNKGYCQDAIEKLYEIGNTNEKSKIFWKFDDSRELLESYVVPNLGEGFFGPIGLKGIEDKGNIQLQVVVGTQTDEMEENFEKTFEAVKNHQQSSLDIMEIYSHNYIHMVLVVLFVMAYKLLKLKEKYYDGRISNND